MTEKEKLVKIKKLADAMYDAAQYLTTDASRLHKAMDEYHKFIIHEWREEPVSKDKLTFTSLPRLLDRIKPTDRVKWYSNRLADALEEEGYITDAKIVRESIKLMNGEKVPMATMDEEPVSEDLEKMSYRSALDLINNPKFLPTTTFGELIPMLQKLYKDGAQWQKTKDESITDYLGDYINELSKQFPEVSFAKLSRIAVRVAKWQRQQDQSTIELAEDHAMLAGKEKMKEQMMAKAVDGIARPYDNEIWCILDSFNLKAGDKVKVIVIKED